MEDFQPISRERTDDELREFAAAFPDQFAAAREDPGSLPGEVWDRVRDGMTLTAAYARYALDSRDRSAGSMASAGRDGGGSDGFLEGWGS